MTISCISRVSLEAKILFCDYDIYPSGGKTVSSAAEVKSKTRKDDRRRMWHAGRCTTADLESAVARNHLQDVEASEANGEKQRG